jgi:arsenate reductase
MFKIYHNNRCSKSREALDLLVSKGLQPEVVHYLDTPLNEAQLRQLLTKLGFSSARQLMRTKEDEYRTLNLADPTLSEAALLAALVAHPRLMERPVVEWQETAVVARPPERLRDFLS